MMLLLAITLKKNVSQLFHFFKNIPSLHHLQTHWLARPEMVSGVPYILCVSRAFSGLLPELSSYNHVPLLLLMATMYSSVH